jgi:bifunctional UDP-N-acetylglucosamine pyrophosphorylase/glucosamine-1-phosphate N-acetyltransferase
LGEGAAVSVLGFEAGAPHGYGRLIRRDGRLVAIREERDATESERAIRLCNAGVMALRGDLALDLLERVRNENAKGEYYLTDVVEIALGDGHSAQVVEAPESEVLGVNDRGQLAAAERIMQDRLRAAAMAGGATLVAPETVYLCADTRIGQDVLIEPHVVFGRGVTIEDGVVIHGFCHLTGARVAAGAEIGPFARLRPGADLGPKVKVGNFVEIKNSRLDDGAKVNHLSYIGDTDLGSRSNVGAGTITCNYDGFFKYRTKIGPDAFIGSNSSLVAPVSIAAGAYVASGSVVTEDVPENALAVARSRQVAKPGWAEAFRESARQRKKG